MKKLSLSFFLLLGLKLIAQQGTVATGGDASGSSGSIAYSIGQIDYTAVSNSSGSFNAGIQQPYEVFVSSVDEHYAQIEMSLFPNPATHFLNLKMDELIPNFHYQIISLDGRILNDVQIIQELTQIDMQSLPSATYILNILDDNKTVKTFKVIKK
jgi:hypothetical protein